MSAHVLLNLLNELGERDKMRGYAEHLIDFTNVFNKFTNVFNKFTNVFNKFNNTGA